MGKAIEDYTLPESFAKIEEALNANPGPIEGITTRYQFTITGAEEGVYQLNLQNGKAEVAEGEEIPADCTLIMSVDNFRQFLLGKLNGTVAFMSGKLKIKGDIGKAIKLEGILKQYNVQDHL